MKLLLAGDVMFCLAKTAGSLITSHVCSYFRRKASQVWVSLDPISGEGRFSYGTGCPLVLDEGWLFSSSVVPPLGDEMLPGGLFKP